MQKADMAMKKTLYAGICIWALIATGCQKTADGPVPTTSKAGTASADYLSAGSGGSSAGGGSTVTSPPAPAGLITAGEWNDLTNWSFWLNLLNNNEYDAYQNRWNLYPNSRLSCFIRDAAGQPCADLLLTVRDQAGRVVWEGHTDVDGHADVLPTYFTSHKNPDYTVSATLQQRAFDLGTLRNGATLMLPAVATQPPSVIDIQLVVDATGSMGDEMTYLKNEFDDVLRRVNQQLPEATLRLSSVFYRDHGDEYVVRELPFTTASNDLMTFIRQQSAGGGGDYEEAVDEALEQAVNSQGWSTTARTRLLFLVLDAPPHYTAPIVDRLRNMVKTASRKGIRLIPITASGINKETEFLMRFLSLGTQGTYVFITNHSGIGNDHLTPTVGDYKVEYLNDLMLRLIVQYAKP